VFTASRTETSALLTHNFPDYLNFYKSRKIKNYMPNSTLDHQGIERRVINTARDNNQVLQVRLKNSDSHYEYTFIVTGPSQRLASQFDAIDRSITRRTENRRYDFKTITSQQLRESKSTEESLGILIYERENN
jgi:hypothetical protein